jgi:aryl sulfotransferase
MSNPDAKQPGMDLFHEICESSTRAVNVRLSAAGFGDISWDELLFLLAVHLSCNTVTDFTRELGLSSRVADKITDDLLVRGYLQPKGDPDASGRTTTAVTRRGFMALYITTMSVLADRWASFQFRPGDIVISTPAKSGTTWLQMICALLIFQTLDLPAPLEDLSPWLDSLYISRDEIYTRLSAQEHRRFIKTHSPLAEISINPQVTYVVVGRHPLDSAISGYYQRDNQRLLPQMRPYSGHAEPGQQNIPPRDWLLEWIDRPAGQPEFAGSLSRVFQHMADAWTKRNAPNIVLMHYEDLSADLEGQMRYLAKRLGIMVPEATWPGLVNAATFKQMRATASRIQPLGSQTLDSAAFFRKGVSGSGTELLTDAELDHYYARAAQMLTPDLLAWLHGPRFREAVQRR